MTNSRASKAKRFLDWLVIRLARSIKVDGLWVGVLSENRSNELLERVNEALQLIKNCDPYRYRRVITEIDRILVYLLPNNTATFVPESRTCLIDPRSIRSYSLEFIASAIVHEATHGTLTRRHIGYSEALRRRVENLCLRQELAFARKIPHGAELRQSIERSLELAPDFWADEVVSKRHREGQIAMARYAGLPNWLVMALLNFRKSKAVGRANLLGLLASLSRGLRQAFCFNR